MLFNNASNAFLNAGVTFFSPKNRSSCFGVNNLKRATSQLGFNSFSVIPVKTKQS